MKRPTLTTGVIAVAGLCILAGGASYTLVQLNTTHTFVSASRAEAYSSLEELRAASANIAIGTVTNSREFSDQGISTTEYHVSVEAQTAQGGDLDSGPEMISVIIDGTPTTVRSDENYHLEEGTKYLLFLLNSNAVGTQYTPYYVTGIWAGIYRLDGADRFIRLVDKVDRLPQELTSRQALAE